MKLLLGILSHGAHFLTEHDPPGGGSSGREDDSGLLREICSRYGIGTPEATGGGLRLAAASALGCLTDGVEPVAREAGRLGAVQVCAAVLRELLPSPPSTAASPAAGSSGIRGGCLEEGDESRRLGIMVCRLLRNIGLSPVSQAAAGPSGALAALTATLTRWGSSMPPPLPLDGGVGYHPPGERGMVRGLGEEEVWRDYGALNQHPMAYYGSQEYKTRQYRGEDAGATEDRRWQQQEEEEEHGDGPPGSPEPWQQHPPPAAAGLPAALPGTSGPVWKGRGGQGLPRPASSVQRGGAEIRLACCEAIGSLLAKHGPAMAAMVSTAGGLTSLAGLLLPPPPEELDPATHQQAATRSLHYY